MILQNNVPKNRFSVYLQVNVGSCNENDNERGMAHLVFINKLLFIIQYRLNI